MFVAGENNHLMVTILGEWFSFVWSGGVLVGDPSARW
jgi:hypothetical protein